MKSLPCSTGLQTERRGLVVSGHISKIDKTLENMGHLPPLCGRHRAVAAFMRRRHLRARARGSTVCMTMPQRPNGRRLPVRRERGVPFSEEGRIPGEKPNVTGVTGLPGPVSEIRSDPTRNGFLRILNPQRKPF
jgi:hypothetical protein